MSPLEPAQSPGADNEIVMIGLDFGTTTSSAMIARARIGLSCITGRMGFSNPEVLYRSEPVFTPYSDGQIRESDIRQLLSGWLKESDFQPEQLFSGGVMITGLAARNNNAEVIASHLRSVFGDLIVATADDPSLESWLAFMGGTSVLSRFHHDTPMINLDIGGGTTNPALGLNGQVMSTGCCFIGARHCRIQPGTRKIVGLSSFGRQLLAALNLPHKPGDILDEPALDLILDFYMAGLVSIVTGDRRLFQSPVGQLHEQVALDLTGVVDPVITLSGGVGEWL